MSANEVRTPKAVSDDYTRIVAKNLEKLINSTDYTQNSLADKLKEYGLSVNQGTVSKYLKGETKVQLSVMVKLCEIFHISISELVNENFTYTDDAISTDSGTLDKLKGTESALVIPKLGEKFISNPQDQDFRGYLQKYFCYFFPTLSNEKRILSGELVLRAGSSVCEANLLLNTNKKVNGETVYKHYSGCAVISNSVHSCYIILSSPEEGEICVINFRHFFIRHQNLDCRMAEVITNGAGERHFPTIHRMLLSRTEISKEHLRLLMPHLHLNSSDIRISKDNLDKLQTESEHYNDLLEHLIHRIKPIEIYAFKEDYVNSTAKQFLSKEETRIFLSRIRERSYKVRYNKVSNKLDETVHELLLSLGYYADTDAED